jgi:hypothetical protein
VQLKPATQAMLALGSVPCVWQSRLSAAYCVVQLTAGWRSQQTPWQSAFDPSQVALGARPALCRNSPEHENAVQAKPHVSPSEGGTSWPLLHVYVAPVLLALLGRY